MANGRFLLSTMMLGFDVCFWTLMNANGYVLRITLIDVVVLFGFTTIVSAIGVGFVLVESAKLVQMALTPMRAITYVSQVVVLTAPGFGLGIPVTLQTLLGNSYIVSIRDNVVGEAWTELGILLALFAISTFFMFRTTSRHDTARNKAGDGYTNETVS